MPLTATLEDIKVYQQKVTRPRLHVKYCVSTLPLRLVRLGNLHK